MKIMKRALALILVCSLLIGATTIYAVEGTETMNVNNTLVIDNIPITDYIAGVSPYDGTVTQLSEYEAQASGVPAGFSGMVTRVGVGSNSSYAGVTLNLASLRLPISEIQEITFRVYLAGGTSLRVSNKGAGSWAVLANVSTNTWVDYTVKADGTGLNGTTLSYFNDGEGYLGVFGMGAKSVSSLYIDSISVVFSDGYVFETDDEIPPVIAYTGPSEVDFTEGDTFVLDGVSAFDEYDNAPATVSYSFSGGALNSAGKLMPGTHTCTVTATDRAGNVASISVTVNVVPDLTLIRLEDVPHIPHDMAIANSTAYAGTLNELTAEQAATKGLPDGYVGSVYEIGRGTDAGYAGVCIDLSEYEIPIGIVESVSFNVLMPTSYSELRIRCGNTTDWVMRCSTASTGNWCTVILGADGSGFYGSTKMATLANSDGNLGAFCLIGRVSGSYSPYYIDSITIKLKDDDKTAPVLSYAGEIDVLTSAGKVFAPDVSAYDEYEGRAIAICYEWSAGALDGEGKMLEGAHTCRISATDYYGNASYVDLNVTVGPPDVTAPEIQFYASEIYVPVGTFYRMAIVAVDDYDAVSVVETWSDGAIDFGGRLAEGTHTLTLTCTDLSGNASVRVVTVYVMSGDSTVGTLIQCGK